jgi:crotonobetainyl-CoA:carnitine CoA-transferase CaiB-like acyl-CoA transferase
MASGRPLEGIVVVELGTSVAAPFAGLILADLGARVIKVENPDGGDYARDWGPPFWKGTASSFVSLNRGKEGMTANFSDAEDLAALRRLILDQADAVIQNLRPGILERFGLEPARLRAEKPGLIWCDIGAFGATGPLAGKPGYDPLVQASSGIMSVTGEGDRPPVRVGVSIVDMGSGMWAAIGLLSALIARARDGSGSHVSTSLYETGLAWMTLPLAGYAADGEVRRPYGSGIAEIVPYQAFETADGWHMVAAGNDHLFRKLCAVLDLNELPQDPAFRTNGERVRHRGRLIPMIQDAIRRFLPDDLSARLDEAGVPNAPLLTVDQVAGHAQTMALEMTVTCDGDELPLVGVPLAFGGERPRARRPAPALGEHDAALKGPKGGSGGG